MILIDWEHILQDVERLNLVHLGSLRILSLCGKMHNGISTRDLKDPVSGQGALEKILLEVASLQKLSRLEISDQNKDITLARFALTVVATQSLT